MQSEPVLDRPGLRPKLRRCEEPEPKVLRHFLRKQGQEPEMVPNEEKPVLWQRG